MSEGERSGRWGERKSGARLHRDKKAMFKDVELYLESNERPLVDFK